MIKVTWIIVVVSIFSNVCVLVHSYMSAAEMAMRENLGKEYKLEQKEKNEDMGISADAEMYKAIIPPNGLPMPKPPPQIAFRKKVYSIADEVDNDSSESIFPEPDRRPFTNDDTYQVDQLPKRLSDTGRWDEFHQLIAAEKRMYPNGIGRENWDDNTHLWASYSKQLLVRGKKYDEKAKALRSRLATEMPYNPNVGLSPYWGEPEPQNTAASTPAVPWGKGPGPAEEFDKLKGPNYGPKFGEDGLDLEQYLKQGLARDGDPKVVSGLGVGNLGQIFSPGQSPGGSQRVGGGQGPGGGSSIGIPPPGLESQGLGNESQLPGRDEDYGPVGPPGRATGWVRGMGRGLGGRPGSGMGQGPGRGPGSGMGPGMGRGLGGGPGSGMGQGPRRPPRAGGPPTQFGPQGSRGPSGSGRPPGAGGPADPFGLPGLNRPSGPRRPPSFGEVSRPGGFSGLGEIPGAGGLPSLGAFTAGGEFRRILNNTNDAYKRRIYFNLKSRPVRTPDTMARQSRNSSYFASEPRLQDTRELNSLVDSWKHISPKSTSESPFVFFDKKMHETPIPENNGGRIPGPAFEGNRPHRYIVSNSNPLSPDERTEGFSKLKMDQLFPGSYSKAEEKSPRPVSGKPTTLKQRIPSMDDYANPIGLNDFPEIIQNALRMGEQSLPRLETKGDLQPGTAVENIARGPLPGHVQGGQSPEMGGGRPLKNMLGNKPLGVEGDSPIENMQRDQPPGMERQQHLGIERGPPSEYGPETKPLGRDVDPLSEYRLGTKPRGLEGGLPTGHTQEGQPPRMERGQLPGYVQGEQPLGMKGSPPSEYRLETNPPEREGSSPIGYMPGGNPVRMGRDPSPEYVQGEQPLGMEGSFPTGYMQAGHHLVMERDPSPGYMQGEQALGMEGSPLSEYKLEAKPPGREEDPQTGYMQGIQPSEKERGPTPGYKQGGQPLGMGESIPPDYMQVIKLAEMEKGFPSEYMQGRPSSGMEGGPPPGYMQGEQSKEMKGAISPEYMQGSQPPDIERIPSQGYMEELRPLEMDGGLPPGYMQGRNPSGMEGETPLEYFQETKSPGMREGSPPGYMQERQPLGIEGGPPPGYMQRRQPQGMRGDLQPEYLQGGQLRTVESSGNRDNQKPSRTVSRTSNLTINHQPNRPTQLRALASLRRGGFPEMDLEHVEGLENYPDPKGMGGKNSMEAAQRMGGGFPQGMGGGFPQGMGGGFPQGMGGGFPQGMRGGMSQGMGGGMPQGMGGGMPQGMGGRMPQGMGGELPLDRPPGRPPRLYGGPPPGWKNKGPSAKSVNPAEIMRGSNGGMGRSPDYDDPSLRQSSAAEAQNKNRLPTGFQLMKIAQKKIAFQDSLAKVTETPPTTEHPPTIEERLKTLRQFDDFNAPIRWVRLASPDTQDGLARVTDKKTHQNQQYVIEGELYVPIVDESMARMGWTTEYYNENETLIEVTTKPPAVGDSIKVVMRSLNLNYTTQSDWLAYETVLGSRFKSETECSSEGCQTRCFKSGCDCTCKGDSCASGCVGVSCNSICKGPGCRSMCIGEQCTAKCEGMNCEAKCSLLSCAFTVNGGPARTSNVTWDELYPHYDQNAQQSNAEAPALRQGPDYDTEYYG